MPRLTCPRLLPVLLCLALLPAHPALAQLQAPSRLEEVEPDPSEEQGQADEPDEASSGDEAASPKAPRAGKPEAAKAAPAAPTQDEPAAPARPPLPPLVVPQVSNAQLLELWKGWQGANAAKDTAKADAALRELLQHKDELEASDFEPLSVGLLRVAAERQTAGDVGAAMQLSEAAVALSPNLPYVRLAYAEALARREPTEVGRYLEEAKLALGALVKDPRYLRATLADLGAMGLFALLMTAVAVVGVLFVRRVRYLLHDFHHFFPRAVDRWQSALLALLLLTTPVVLGLGLVPVLLVLLAAVTVYLSVAERAVAWGLLALVGLSPLAAGQLARATAFPGTVAEDVYLLERGGFAADDAAARVRARHEARAATFAELFALGRFESRRGQLEDALAHYKAASTLRSGDTGLLTNWGNALLASGNPDGASELYMAASKGATLAAPSYNLAMVLRRKAKTVPDEAVSGVLNQAREAINIANDLDPSLLQRDPPPEDRLLVGRLVLSLPLPASELDGLARADGIGERMEAQLSRALMAGMTGPVAWGLPALAGGLLFAWGFLRSGLKASKVCEKCGRAVCRRCDPELGIGSNMCTQCVNVFSRKGQVPPQMRARKEAQVFSHQAWMERLALGLSAVVSGAGHVFSGLPLRGALYTFLFLFGVGAVVFHDGVMRAPYGEVPTYLKLTFAGLLLLPVYTLTLRGLYKRQNG